MKLLLASGEFQYSTDTMHYRILFATTLLLPLSALALDFSAHTQYADVHPLSQEAAAIHMLTNENVAHGYANGFFGASRKINRAEFLKMALLSAPQQKRSNLAAFLTQQSTCFADVPATAWFHGYACYAKQYHIVEGYKKLALSLHTGGSMIMGEQAYMMPDKEVTYGEALKILVSIYGYETDGSNAKSWAEPYYRAAAKRLVDLPITLELESVLTRGQASRLIAGFRAQFDGVLVEYRMAEQGIVASSSTSVLSSSLSSISSSASSAFSLPPASSSVSPVNQSSSSASVSSHFLIIGQTSDVIADGIIRSNGESAHIHSAQIKLYNEMKSVDAIRLEKDDGTLIMTLHKRNTANTSDYKQIYEKDLDINDVVALAKDQDMHIVARADVNDLNNNGISDEWLNIRSFTVTYVTDTTHETKNTVFPIPFPEHSTAFGRITRVKNNGDTTGVLRSGSAKKIASFAFSGTVIAGKNLLIEHLLFTLKTTGQIHLGNIKLLNTTNGKIKECFISTHDVLCSPLSGEFAKISQNSPPLILDMYTDIDNVSQGSSLQLSLQDPGSIGQALGAIQWTDESGHFRWIESSTPIAEGTLWQY